MWISNDLKTKSVSGLSNVTFDYGANTVISAEMLINREHPKLDPLEYPQYQVFHLSEAILTIDSV